MPKNGQIKWFRCTFLYARERPNKVAQVYYSILFWFFLFLSNTSTVLKIMESKTSIPANWNEIPKFKSDTSKWVYFFANVTEDVWIQLKECLEADYRRQLHFQLTQDGY